MIDRTGQVWRPRHGTLLLVLQTEQSCSYPGELAYHWCVRLDDPIDEGLVGEQLTLGESSDRPWGEHPERDGMERVL